MVTEGGLSLEFTDSNPLKDKYDPLLWQRAEDLSNIRTPLELHQNTLFDEVAAMHSRTLNLHEQDLLAQKEAEYWRIIEKVKTIAHQEDQIMEAIQSIDTGKIDEETLKKLAPQPEEETVELSKKKKRIMEEKQRLGMNQTEIAWDMYAEFGADPTRLTTGRNQSHVTGNFDPVDAPGQFFFHTADSHGGKVAHGKRGSSYTTVGGKRIRKV